MLVSDTATSTICQTHLIIFKIDAGKSTICGNILFQSGAVSERDMQKYAKEAADKGMDSWLWAYLMDINKEERERVRTFADNTRKNTF